MVDVGSFMGLKPTEPPDRSTALPLPAADEPPAESSRPSTLMGWKPLPTLRCAFATFLFSFAFFFLPSWLLWQHPCRLSSSVLLQLPDLSE